MNPIRVMNNTPGMRSFLIFWTGQVFSLLGTAMTRFALTIWVYQITGEATALSIMAFCAFAPEIALSPLAGALVDRWNRKWMMAIADLAAGLATAALMILYFTGSLQIWHIYVAGGVAGVFSSFHWPAYSASVTLMVPKSQYARATALSTLAESGTYILAPILAAAMIGFASIGWIFVVDVTTMSLAIIILAFTPILSPKRSQAGAEGAGSLWKESWYGFRYIFANKGLLGLQLIFLFGNLFASLSWTLAAPMILAKTANSAATLAVAESAGGIGGVVGGLVLSITGGLFRRKTDGIFIGWALPFLFLGVFVGFGQSLPMWMAGFFLSASVGSITYICNQAIWQSKVPPDIQGRVFSTRRMIAQAVSPLATLVAGPLADRVFEPAMKAGGSLSGALGPIFGTGAGAGMAVMIVLASVLGAVVGFSGYLFPVVRDVEKNIPDHDTLPIVIEERWSAEESKVAEKGASMAKPETIAILAPENPPIS